jgi:hypothetical protein
MMTRRYRPPADYRRRQPDAVRDEEIDKTFAALLEQASAIIGRYKAGELSEADAVRALSALEFGRPRKSRRKTSR